MFLSELIQKHEREQLLRRIVYRLNHRQDKNSSDVQDTIGICIILFKGTYRKNKKIPLTFYSMHYENSRHKRIRI